MKKELKIIVILSLVLGLWACGGNENSQNNNEVNLSNTINPNEILLINTNQVEPDTIESVSVPVVSREEVLQQIKLLAVELQSNYNKMADKENRYVENVAFTTFLGKDVEVGELEIRKIGNNFTRVYADYFDGGPTGGKRFLIKNDSLFQVEIIRLNEKTTENGAVIIETKTHTFYYNNEQLIQIWDNKNNVEIDSTAIKWAAENLRDWALVKKNL